MKKSIEVLKIKFEEFYNKHGHYPTQHEISKHIGVSARTLQREYGSLKKVRELLGLPILDFTKGESRAKKALNSFNTSTKEKERIYKKLLPIFKEYYIHRESPFGDMSRQRSDFKIYHKEGLFYVDIYYTETYENMIGCVNAKLKKYNPDYIYGTIILINTNKNLKNANQKLISNKKNKLPENIKLMNEEEFFQYCKNFSSIV